jgi:Tol biopolymer transport system component
VAVGSTTAGYGEGRFSVFVSNAAGMVSGISNASRQVYWHDALTGETRLVSASADGVAGNGDSGAPAISADGLTVAFESDASNLVTGDTNGVRDVFVRAMFVSTDPVRRVSVGAAGVQANSESFDATLSGDGSVVAFSSGASNLTPGVSGTSTINVYRRDLGTSTNTLASAHVNTGAGVGGSKPALSEDGKRLAFYSFSSNIVAGDVNGLWDIFVFDAGTGQRTRVSLTNSGGERNQGTESASREVAPAISGNGRFVAFATTASNMVDGDTNSAQDVFVVDTQTGKVVRASVDGAGAQGTTQGNADSPSTQGERPALSYDGAWVAFSRVCCRRAIGRTLCVHGPVCALHGCGVVVVVDQLMGHKQADALLCAPPATTVC